MIRVIIYIVLVFIFSCSENNTTEKQSDFKVYLKKIMTLNLPIMGKCEVGYDQLDFNLFTRNEIVNIRPNQYYIHGKIIKDSLVLVLYSKPGDINYPILYIYDKKGAVIDTLRLYLNECVSDAYIDQEFDYSIDEDLNIILNGKEIFYKLDKEGNVIDSLTEEIDVVEDYLINPSNGRIVPQNN